MRELSKEEKAFLERSVASRETFQRPRGIKSRFTALIGTFVRYIPLAIGLITLGLSGFVTYLYFWIQNYFGANSLQNMEEMKISGALALADPQAAAWINEILKIYTVMPWVIFGLLFLGIILMGLSIVLIGRKKNV